MLTLAMLIPAGAAACCIAADPHRRDPGVWLPAVLMLAAMTDAALLRLLPALLWAALLVASAMGAALAGRVTGRTDAMQLHRGVASVVMAFALVGVAPASAGHQHGSDSSALLAIAVAAVLASGAWLAYRLARRGRLLLAAEPVLMGLSLAAMHLAH